MNYDGDHEALAARIREVLREHQREGLNMIGNVDKLVTTLVEAVQEWMQQPRAAEKRSA